MIIELLQNLYNRPDKGFFVQEVFGTRHGKNSFKVISYIHHTLTRPLC